MFFLTIVGDYITWHYSTALLSFVRIYKNLWWFLTQFFSIPQLSVSLLAPYKRMTEHRGSLLDIEAWVGFFAINVMSRLLGFFIRIMIISVGLLSLLVLSLGAVTTYALWLIAPFLVVFCFTFGVYLLF